MFVVITNARPLRYVCTMMMFLTILVPSSPIKQRSKTKIPGNKIQVVPNAKRNALSSQTLRLQTQLGFA